MASSGYKIKNETIKKISLVKFYANKEIIFIYESMISYDIFKNIIKIIYYRCNLSLFGVDFYIFYSSNSIRDAY